VALMLPYSIAFGLSSTLLFGLWFIAGLPLGPEALPGAMATGTP